MVYWVQHWLQMSCVEKEVNQNQLMDNFCKMSIKAMNFLLPKLVLEVRRKYSPETLYQICCGLLHLLKEADRADIKILANPMFIWFRASLLEHPTVLLKISITTKVSKGQFCDMCMIFRCSNIICMLLF